MAPHAPLFGTVCSLVRQCMLPCSAPYAPLFGNVCSLVQHRMLPCSAPYAPSALGKSLGLRPFFVVYPSSRPNTVVFMHEVNSDLASIITEPLNNTVNIRQTQKIIDQGDFLLKF